MKTFPIPLTQAEEEDAICRLRNGDSEARKTLILHNLRLVAHVIKKYVFSEAEQDEYISIGIIGLIKAIDSFDDSKGIRLATYASRCIDNEILMVLRAGKKLSREVYLSDSVGKDKEGNDINLIDVLESPDNEPGYDLILSEDISRLRRALSDKLEHRERQIILLRYGFIDNKVYTQREIAKKYGISRSYVSRLEKKAIDKLKSSMK